MPLSFEMFATGAMPPEQLWAVVGDPERLPDWTDAADVRVPERPLAEGDEVRTTVDGSPLAWTVVTLGERIWEARASTAAGTLGLGARVVPDPRGSRLVLACALEPAGARVVARLITLPRLRGRFDRWSTEAMRLAWEAR